MKTPVIGKTKKVTTEVPKAEPKTSSKKKVFSSVALKPRVSEKAYGLSENSNVYTFDVGPCINKFDIARAVRAQFEVEATKVRIVSVPGKQLRRYRDRGRKSLQGRRSDIRKAYVTLKKGDKLPIFAAIEETAAKPEKEQK